MPGKYSKIRVERPFEGALLHIILNAPKGNILDSVMMDGVVECIRGEGGGRGVRLILFEGEGNHFSFGASVEEHRREKAPQMILKFHAIFRALIEVATPSASLVRGQCLGGGMELAAFCNFVFAKEGAAFGQPEIRLGVFPPPASVILPLRLGQGYADSLILTGESVDAKQGKEIGLVDLLIPEEADERAFVFDWFEKTLLPKSASSLRFANRAARMHFNEIFLATIEKIESLYLKGLMETADASEGILSFLEKRAPSWKDR